jgi:hypothetical protein
MIMVILTVSYSATLIARFWMFKAIILPEPIFTHNPICAKITTVAYNINISPYPTIYYCIGWLYMEARQ